MKKCPPLLRLPSCLLFYFTPNPISSCLRCEQGLLSLSTPLLLLSKRAPAPCLSNSFNRNRPRVQASTSSTASLLLQGVPFSYVQLSGVEVRLQLYILVAIGFAALLSLISFCPSPGYYHLVPLDVRPRGRGLYGSERGCAERNGFCV